MFKEPNALREIHKIQEQIYHERKNLSDKEFVGRTHKVVEEIKKKYGLRLKHKIPS